MAAKKTRTSFSKRRPDDCQRPIRYQVMRIPQRGCKDIVCLSHDLAGFDTHYSGRRTSICLPQNCTGCGVGAEIRWYGWFAGAPKSLDRIDIVQVTEGSAGAFDQYFKRHRTLRGAVIDFCRIPAVVNGRLYARMTTLDIDHAELPKAPNVEKIIMHMMRVTVEQLTPLDAPIVPTLKGVPGDNGDAEESGAIRGHRPASVRLGDGMERAGRS